MCMASGRRAWRRRKKKPFFRSSSPLRILFLLLNRSAVINQHPAGPSRSRQQQAGVMNAQHRRDVNQPHSRLESDYTNEPVGGDAKGGTNTGKTAWLAR